MENLFIAISSRKFELIIQYCLFKQIKTANNIPTVKSTASWFFLGNETFP